MRMMVSFETGKVGATIIEKFACIQTYDNNRGGVLESNQS